MRAFQGSRYYIGSEKHCNILESIIPYMQTDHLIRHIDGISPQKLPPVSDTKNLSVDQPLELICNSLKLLNVRWPSFGEGAGM